MKRNANWRNLLSVRKRSSNLGWSVFFPVQSFSPTDEQNKWAVSGLALNNESVALYSNWFNFDCEAERLSSTALKLHWNSVPKFAKLPCRHNFPCQKWEKHCHTTSSKIFWSHHLNKVITGDIYANVSHKQNCEFSNEMVCCFRERDKREYKSKRSPHVCWLLFQAY